MNEISADIRLASVKGRPARLERAAEPGELDAIAARLGVARVERFELKAELAVLPEGDVYLARGDVSLVAERTCVVTLEPFLEQTAVTFEEYFTTAPTKATTEADAIDPDETEIELLEDDRVEFGEIALQHAAMALNPYPRAPEAPPAEPGEDLPIGPTPQRPFAGLDSLLANARRKE